LLVQAKCFMSEYQTTGQGFVVCRAPYPLKISDKVIAIPWRTFFDELPWP